MKTSRALSTKNENTVVQIKNGQGTSIQPPLYGLPVIDNRIIQKKEVAQLGGAFSKARPIVKSVAPKAKVAVQDGRLDHFTLQLLLRDKNYLTHGTNNESVGTLKASNEPQTGLDRTNSAAAPAVFALNDWRNAYGDYIIFYRKSPIWKANQHDPLTYLRYGEVDPKEAFGWALRDDVIKAASKKN